MSENDKIDANPPGSNAAAVEAGATDEAAQDETASDGLADDEGDPNLAGLSAQLRGLYKGLLDEPIPDRFVQLLKELESKESDSK